MLKDKQIKTPKRRKGEDKIPKSGGGNKKGGNQNFLKKLEGETHLGGHCGKRLRK